MASFFEIKKAAGTLMEQSASIAEQLHFNAAAENIRANMEAFHKKELTVVVAGEARRGKSSLLNALLDQKEPVFPVDINVCTNVVTILHYGQTESIEVSIADKQCEKGFRVEQISRDQIVDYVSEKGNPNNYKQVKKLEACIPNPVLKDGIVFVDTPGVGSLNVEHAETTYAFLPYADMLLFVGDAVAPFTESELKFLKRASGYCDTILYPLTKKDLNPDYTTILEDNRRKISRTLDIDPAQVQVIPVASPAKIKYLETNRKFLYKNSNFEAFEKAIWTTVAKQHSQVLIRPFLQSTQDEMRKLSDSIRSQYQILGNQTAGTELNEKLQAEKERLDQLQTDGAGWKNELSVFFSNLLGTIGVSRQNIGTDAGNLVTDRVQRLGTRICVRENYLQLLSEVNERIAHGIMDIQEHISSELDDEISRLHTAMGLDLEVNEGALKSIRFEGADTLEIRFPPQKKSEKVIAKGRNITMNSMGGSAAGGLIGGVLGGIIGFCIGGPAGAALIAEQGVCLGAGVGGLAGGTKGVVEAFDRYNNLDVNTVSQRMNKYIASSILEASVVINNSLTQLRIETAAALDQQLKQAAREIQESILANKKALAIETQRIPEKQAELKRIAAVIQKRVDEIAALEDHIAQWTAAVPALAHEARPMLPVLQQNTSEAEPGNAEQTAGGASEAEYAFL